MVGRPGGRTVGPGRNGSRRLAGQCLLVIGVVGKAHPHLDGFSRVGVSVVANPLVAEFNVGQTVPVGNVRRGCGKRFARLGHSRDGGLTRGVSRRRQDPGGLGQGKEGSDRRQHQEQPGQPDRGPSAAPGARRAAKAGSSAGHGHSRSEVCGLAHQGMGSRPPRAGVAVRIPAGMGRMGPQTPHRDTRAESMDPGRAVCRTGPSRDPVRPYSSGTPAEDLAFRSSVSPSLVRSFARSLVHLSPVHSWPWMPAHQAGLPRVRATLRFRRAR